MRPGGPQSCCGHFAEVKSLLPMLEISSLVVQPVALLLASYVILTNVYFL